MSLKHIVFSLLFTVFSIYIAFLNPHESTFHLTQSLTFKLPTVVLLLAAVFTGVLISIAIFWTFNLKNTFSRWKLNLQKSRGKSKLKRIENLFNKSDAFDRCLSCKPSLAAALYLLNEFKTFSLNGRFPIKGAGEQVLHSDFPRTNPTDWRGVNNMIMLDDMNLDNGRIRVVPGSHNCV